MILDQGLVLKVLSAVALFFVMQMVFMWSKLENFDEKKLTVEAEIETLERKKENLQMRTWELERNIHRLELATERLEEKIRDRLPLMKDRKNFPTIYFVTPTHYRLAQKADLTRLAQTLARVPSIFWLVVEDSTSLSSSIADILRRSGLPHAHLHIPTPVNMKMSDRDPNWKLPRGVPQRNAALKWLRVNFKGLSRGVVYFGDDDNVYDWRLFEEMRSVRRVGIWPVGIVGGLLVETPILEDGKVSSFNSIWKPDRPFPVDMAAFAVNLSLINERPNASFTYDVPRGYQESHFLTSLGIAVTDLEPKAESCQSVFVWHTRTEKIKLDAAERTKFLSRNFTRLELDAIG